MKKRVIISSVLVILFMVFIAIRIAYISLSKVYLVADTYNSYVLTIDTIEPNLYYSNYKKLTNNEYEKYALLKPNAKTLAELPSIFSDTDLIIKELRAGKPILRKTNAVNTNYIQLINVTSSSNNCKQLVSRECSGLLSYLPTTVGEKKMRFLVDAKGRMLSGDEGMVIYDNYVSSEGLLLTLDSEVQNLAVNASKSIDSGCIVIMDVKNSSILSCVSKPDDTFINKPFSLFSVGSVFKLIIAACALENNISPKYECKGKIEVGDTVYSCQNEKVHGYLNLETALVNSCNCYFINLAKQMGADRILKTAKDFGFGEEIKIYKNWIINGSRLPSESEMNSNGELPLIGFGQGRLMSTPLQFCNALCTIANGGFKNSVKLVKAEVDKYGNQTFIDYKSKSRIISNKTSYLLLKYMRSVVKNGSGKNADYNNQSAGKTATAQTGQFDNGIEKLNTWFAGIYPYNNPKYAIVIMVENGKSGAESCCPVFRTIVENLK